MTRDPFPRTTVAGVSLSRMLIGTNWMLGFSHTSSAADALIHRTARNAKAIADIVATFLERGVDAVMGLYPGNDALIDGVKMAEDRVGRKAVRIDTPIIDVADTPEARRSAEAMFDQSRALGAVFCMPHHTSVEQLVDKGRQRIHRLPDYLAMIRDRGMLPGLSALRLKMQSKPRDSRNSRLSDRVSWDPAGWSRSVGAFGLTLSRGGSNWARARTPRSGVGNTGMPRRCIFSFSSRSTSAPPRKMISSLAPEVTTREASTMGSPKMTPRVS